jgi:methylenetetrahydrofolate--tRNA-(uracil-5-)-methyltransferase
LAAGHNLKEAPGKSATGALARYVSSADPKTYQPANITFALLEPLAEEHRRCVRRKMERRQLQVELALKEWDTWLHTIYDTQNSLQVTAV